MYALQERPQRDHMLVVGLLARKHEAQRHEREIGRPRTEDLHALIERTRFGHVGRMHHEMLDHLRFARAPLKKIPVDQLETHAMLFAAHVALLFALSNDLTELLDRMRTVSGPVWRAHTTSTSHLTFSDGTADVHSEAQGLRFSTYECEGEQLCAGTYFDGERIYSININGTTLPNSNGSDPYLRGQRTIASLAFLAPDFEENGGSISDGDTTTISGTKYRTLVVSNGDGTAMDVFVDPKTATVRYFRDVNGDLSFEYRDYREVNGGLYLPFLVLRNGQGLEKYDERNTTSDEFAAPHGPKPTFAGASAPIKTDPDRTIPIVPCTIGSITTNCLIDSGNSGLAMSQELSEQLHAQQVGEFQVRGLGNYSTAVVRGDSLVVGNATFPAANYVVLNDIHKFGYDVVLGADFFASTTIAIDATHNQVTLEATPPAKGTSVNLIFQSFVPVLMVRLGRLGTQLALDTGDESNINLSYDFYEEHRDLFSATEQRKVAGVGGTSVELIGTIPEVRVGDLLLDHQRIGATPALRGTAFGHLGAAFLSHFNVVIDYAGERVFFTTPTP